MGVGPHSVSRGWGPAKQTKNADRSPVAIRAPEYLELKINKIQRRAAAQQQDGGEGKAAGDALDRGAGRGWGPGPQTKK